MGLARPEPQKLMPFLAHLAESLPLALGLKLAFGH